MPTVSMSVPDPAMRQKIMALRQDPAANAAMAGAFTSTNASQLAAKLGRSATEGELYMAHFLGANGASRLISLAARAIPKRSARRSLSASRAGQPFDLLRRGRARRAAASDVYASLAGRYATARAGVGTACAASTVPATSPAAVAPVRTANNVTPLSNVYCRVDHGGEIAAVARAVADGNMTRSFHKSLQRRPQRTRLARGTGLMEFSAPRRGQRLSGAETPPRPLRHRHGSAAPEAAWPGRFAGDAGERVRNLFNDLMSSYSAPERQPERVNTLGHLHKDLW